MSDWRPIPGWAGFYEASPEGLVRSVTRHGVKGRVLRYGRTHNGYPTVTFSSNGRRHTRTLHTVIAETFLGPRPAVLVVCHNDDDKDNNAVSNLRYDTQSANERDKVRHGLHHLANRTSCIHGHAYTPENTRRHRDGRRSCKACHRERNRRARAEKRAA